MHINTFHQCNTLHLNIECQPTLYLITISTTEIYGKPSKQSCCLQFSNWTCELPHLGGRLRNWHSSLIHVHAKTTFMVEWSGYYSQSICAITFYAAVVLAVCAQEEELPHVHSCYLCHKCWYTKDRGHTFLTHSANEFSIERQQDAAQYIVPDYEKQQVKKQLPNCTECWGCSTQLRPIGAVKALGHKFAAEQGASAEWLFVADLPPGHPVGPKAIVKVWCLPIDKVTGEFTVRCGPDEAHPDQQGVAERHAVESVQHLLALDRVTHDCGLHDVVIKVWTAPVNAIVPGFGYHIWWHGLWMERAHGFSLNQLAYISKANLVEDLIIGLIQGKMNRTQVVRAAVFDLLTGQCDRHAQNVFISQEGNLKLIDNLNSLQLHWKFCGQDSIFLPGTQKNEIVRFGGAIIGKRPGAKRRRTTNPLVNLDYRCYVHGGALGTELPPDVSQCVHKLAGMTSDQAQQVYGFTEPRVADNLLSRAIDLKTKGFEWALKKGAPTNPPPLRYRWHQPCCEIAFDRHKGIQCAHAWNVTPSIPLGDPYRGGQWQFPGQQDPGTYDGSTLWQDLE